MTKIWWNLTEIGKINPWLVKFDQKLVKYLLILFLILVWYNMKFQCKNLNEKILLSTRGGVKLKSFSFFIVFILFYWCKCIDLTVRNPKLYNSWYLNILKEDNWPQIWEHRKFSCPLKSLRGYKSKTFDATNL